MDWFPYDWDLHLEWVKSEEKSTDFVTHNDVDEILLERIITIFKRVWLSKRSDFTQHDVEETAIMTENVNEKQKVNNVI